MLHSMLGAHPQIQGLGEINVFNQPRRWSSRSLCHINHIRKVTDYLLRSDIKVTANRWLEKTPTNVWYLGDLLREFEDRIRVIHLVRDGRAVVTSYHPDCPDRYWVPPTRWIRDVECGLEFAAHESVMTLRYEDLVENRPRYMKEVLEFLELPMDEAVLRRNQDMPPRRIGHGANEEIWKQSQHKAVVEKLMAEPRAQVLLDRLGYTGARQAQRG
jgi:hypothetical protein